MLTSISADGSFRTAMEEPLGSASTQGTMGEESIDSVPEASEQMPSGADKDSNGTARGLVIDSVPEASKANTGNARLNADVRSDNGSVSHSALEPLHDLLRHATSVTECRMLISAFLLQLGVKRLAEDEMVDPEHKVMAWLLAGGDGPFDAPAGISSRAFAPSASAAREGGESTKGQAVETEEPIENKAESVSAHTERTAETEDAGNTSGMTEDAAEPVTPETMSSRPSAEAVVPVKTA
jgi:hypothetical protein